MEIFWNEPSKSFCNVNKVLVLDLSCGSQVSLSTSSQYVIDVLYNFFLCIIFEKKRLSEKKCIPQSYKLASISQNPIIIAPWIFFLKNPIKWLKRHLCFFSLNHPVCKYLLNKLSAYYVTGNFSRH